MPSKSKIKKIVKELDNDFRRMGIGRKEQANEIGYGTNEVKLGKLYNGYIIDATAIANLKRLRDERLNKILELIDTP